ncbi:hypothetical protein GO755_25860 [Spirosoma sp. HMF4905]|uniref:Uncharacterized protein n=1 Tax=Spirosoma arboris TaxID=2682092 RepID=A0A7K1SI40_9BACT|nr:hypothetical protein [Spirosoma arboris]MVM33489.1 hypothetical protein [Spirosoma arboris]
MAWINIASNRFDIRQKLIKSLANWGKETELIGNHKLGLLGLMCGDDKLYEETKKFTDKWLAYYVEKDNNVLRQDTVFPVFTNLALLAYIGNSHSDNHLKRAAELKLPNHKLHRSLQVLIRKIIENDFSDLEHTGIHEGHIDTEHEWLELIPKTNIGNLFDLALCPDHPLWSMTLSSFCLPLAILLHRSHHSENPETELNDYLQLGAKPDQHQQVVFERQSPKPPIETELTDNPTTWPGFDAIEIKAGKLVIYHWLGFDWQASLNFDPNEQINAFHSLLTMEYGWKLLEEQVDKNTWMTIQIYRESNSIMHVIAYNKRWSKENKNQTQKAIDFLKTDVELLDFLTV